MGYKIVYGKHPIKMKSNVRLPFLIAAFFLLFVVTVYVFAPEATDQLRNILISENIDASMQAFVAMVEELAAGESVAEAVQAFCQEVFRGE